MSALTISGLHAGYGPVKVLHDANLSVGQGEMVTVIGANGAGKTTLLRVISGLLRASSGEVVVFGQETTTWPAERLAGHGVSHVPQNRLVFPGLTVADNLQLGAYSRKDADVGRDRERVLDLFPKLTTRLQQRAGTLSGGEQQMLAVGRALMAQPRLLLLDEPSLGLAPMLVREIFAAIIRLRRESNVSVLLIEQNARAAMAVADRAYVLERGRVVTEGPTERLTDDPAIQAAYLGGEPTAAPGLPSPGGVER